LFFAESVVHHIAEAESLGPKRDGGESRPPYVKQAAGYKSFLDWPLFLAFDDFSSLPPTLSTKSMHDQACHISQTAASAKAI